MSVFYQRVSRKPFQDFVDRGEIPNMLLSGPPGIGKTTVAESIV